MGWLRRLRNSWSGNTDGFDEEARFHLEQRTREYIAAGMSAGDARRAALRRFGSVALAKDRTGDADLFRWIDDFRRDAGYGVRMLWRSPAFSLLAIFCLTIGVGANAAVFSWVEGVLLRPYPLVAGEDRLVAVTGIDRGGSGDPDMSWPDWQDLQRRSTLVDAFIADKITGTTLTVGDHAERVVGSMVSANYFDALGVRPLLGRGFLPGEDVGRNAHPITVISYQLWQNRFHGDPAIIGQAQMLNGLPHTIVGVAPQGFYGTFVGYAFQFWVPASMQPQFSAGVYKLEDRGARWIEGFARLKRGVTIPQAQSELSAIMARLEAEHPDTNRGEGIRLFPLWQTPFNGASTMLPALGVALVVVLSVLLVACANVGNLLLVRAFARQQEMTIRLSIGAGRARLIKQLLTEGLILSAIAGVGGFAIAHWLRDALALAVPPRSGITFRFAGALDWRVLALSAAICIASTLLFGIVPALVTSDIDLAGALRSQSGPVGGSRRAAWLRSALVVVQVAFSVVLLVGAGLLLRSFHAMRTASPGFATDGVLTTWIDTFAAGYDRPRARNFQDELIERVRNIGGVQSAAFSATTPFSYASTATAPIAVDGYDAPRDQQPSADYNTVGSGYFDTLGIPILSGRAFNDDDDERGEPVAIVDDTMAAQFWRGANPVGSRFRAKDQWLKVVGVARAVKTRNFIAPLHAYFYVPLHQHPTSNVGLHIRTSLQPAAISPSLVREVRALDPNIAPAELITMRDQVDRMGTSQVVALTMLTIFGALALVLAAIGLYGVMSATVAQGTRQMALRIALGAEAGHLLRLVLGAGLTATAMGVVIGGACAFEGTRLMGYLLYNVSPRDPEVFAAAVSIVLLSSVLACVVPAWRATRTDPLQALRA